MFKIVCWSDVNILGLMSSATEDQGTVVFNYVHIAELLLTNTNAIYNIYTSWLYFSFTAT